MEVNDFNAIRIGIASPDLIHSWSYGEVTKPETINYRTLKPEKDGLFCEKIFGPTKDWECYCGKYKRVRFKGIVCDKCGVEVARAKVRRERMGHIDLASPVSHIWYFKGTPSRLGVLLDISPRNLEKVLYFAAYITISVDAEARQRAIEGIEAAVAERSTQVDVATTEQQQVIETKVQEEFDRLDAEKHQRIAELLMGISPMAGNSEADVVDGETQSSGSVDGAQLEDETRRIGSETDREKERIRAVANSEIDALARKMNEEIETLEASIQSKKDSVDKIAPMQFLTDTQYRELQEVAPGIFRAGMGAEAILEIIRELDLETLSAQLRHDVHSSSSQKRKKAIKRLRVVENFRRSAQKAKPEWMILTVLPVLPPDLRPMVQLDGGRFATSDLNDLYRRVINRNNRLKRLLELGAPEIIIRNEKRMLQEACDALIDNGRRGRAVAGSTNHKLKSLSDMLRGKQGRFRQNLLGKRVDYSGRSVIVVGPDLKLHQCGLPKKMALELFKPFVMRKLVEHGHAPNIKSAKRVVERGRGEVWDVLEEVIQGHPVLLNRAPTLHRLGIQAFDPVLVEGSAIQIHPLVCTAFNADFDGDQMAVHVPLSEQSQREARELMMANNNLLSPASGEPIVAPTKDMVVGLYYLTLERDGMLGEGRAFGSFEEVMLARDLGMVDLHAKVLVRVTDEDFPEPPVAAGVTYGWSELFPTTVGRIILNSVLPKRLRFHNETLDKTRVKGLVSSCMMASRHDPSLDDAQRFLELDARFRETAEVVDRLKYLGFRYATVSGITMAISDIHIPIEKKRIVSEADEETNRADRNFNRGLITEAEKSSKLVEIWTHAMTEVERAVKAELNPDGPVHMMASSGAAKGGFQQIRQVAGMRGLMADTKGRLKEGLPVKTNFREGLMPLEYFLSTHGARKGLADTAMKTAEAGYLTRRLIDVAQDVGVRETDCGTVQGILVLRPDDRSVSSALANRILGRKTVEHVVDPETGEVIVEARGEIDERALRAIEQSKIQVFRVRSPLTCEARYGICSDCYGRNLATARPVELGAAVGIVAAQSIGEPGTQLTMRTFHTGGSAADAQKRTIWAKDGKTIEREEYVAVDVTTAEGGLKRVEELFEARVPKGAAIISHIEGRVELLPGDALRVRVVSAQPFSEPVRLPEGFELLIGLEGKVVAAGDVVAYRQRPTRKVGSSEADAVDGETQSSGALAGAGNAGSSEADAVDGETQSSGALARAGIAGSSEPKDAEPVNLALLLSDDKVVAPVAGVLTVEGSDIVVRYEEVDDREYLIPPSTRLLVSTGQMVRAGDALTDGPKNPQDILAVLGREAVQRYLVSEVQGVYRSQGVSINDKHIEVITRQMLRKVRVDAPGDSELLPGEIVDRFHYEEVNQRVLAEGGEPAAAQTVLLGVTKASLSTESFLAAASFQETTRVLTEAAVTGAKDKLIGLKENVIIGKLIPAGTGYLKRLERAEQLRLAAQVEAERLDEAEAIEKAARAFLGVGAGSDDDDNIPRLFQDEAE